MASHIAVYPISSNPPTFGHADILIRASRQFDHVFWAAAVNPTKAYLFTQQERVEMMQAYVDHYQLENVTVDSFTGATVRYAQSKQACAIVKGLRSVDDFHPEQQQALGNAVIVPEIETFCLFGRPERFQISSSLVRELAFLGESIETYVLPSVAQVVTAAVTRSNS